MDALATQPKPDSTISTEKYKLIFGYYVNEQEEILLMEHEVKKDNIPVGIEYVLPAAKKPESTTDSSQITLANACQKKIGFPFKVLAKVRFGEGGTYTDTRSEIKCELYKLKLQSVMEDVPQGVSFANIQTLQKNKWTHNGIQLSPLTIDILKELLVQLQ
jgi:hypothetical protein